MLVSFLLATERRPSLSCCFLRVVMFVDTIFRPFLDPVSRPISDPWFPDVFFFDVSVRTDETDLDDVSFLLLVTDVTDFSNVGISFLFTKLST